MLLPDVTTKFPPSLVTTNYLIDYLTPSDYIRNFIFDFSILSPCAFTAPFPLYLTKSVSQKTKEPTRVLQ